MNVERVRAPRQPEMEEVSELKTELKLGLGAPDLFVLPWLLGSESARTKFLMKCQGHHPFPKISGIHNHGWILFHVVAQGHDV